MEARHVIAGLDPAIHPPEAIHLFDGCAGHSPRMTVPNKPELL
jgi:hypothetical protein